MSELKNICDVFMESILLQEKIMENVFVLSNHSDTVRLVSEELNKEINPTVLYLIKQFPEKLKIALLPNLVEIMSHLDGNTKICQDIILSIDKKWLSDNIWKYSEHIFMRDDYQSIGIFMYLFNSISESLSKKLANFALSSVDEDVREIGEIYFEKNAFIEDKS